MKMVWASRAIQKLFLLLFILHSAYAQGRDQLELSAGTVSTAVSLSTSLRIRVRLKNVGTNAVYVYKDFGCCIKTFASTVSGREINEEFIEETLPPPPRRDDFTLLKPGHFLESVINEPLSNLGIRDTGSYRIHLDYSPHFGRRTDTFGIPVWSGALESSVNVTVTKSTPI